MKGVLANDRPSPELVALTLRRVRLGEVSYAEAGRILGVTAERVRGMLGEDATPTNRERS